MRYHEFMRVTSIAARVLLSELAKRGIPPCTALSGMRMEGIDFSTETYIDGELFEDLLVRAVTLTGDSAFGLTWAKSMSPANWGLLYQLSAVVPTFSEAMSAVVRFMPAYCDTDTFTLHELPDRFVVKLLPRARTEVGLRVKSELAMRLNWEMFCGFVGPDARAHRVRFAYPAPAYRNEYDRGFRLAVDFDQDETALELPISLAQRKQPHEDKVLQNILQAQARVRWATADTSWASRVAAYLDSAAPESLPGISKTARHFGMSERSLRRKLEAEGRSFGSLADDVRASTGTRWLTESEMPIKEIAYQLGFSRPSAFHRAFKRWTGFSPAECRARATRGPSRRNR
ncbi:helix-turn-helix domain-containing protein [Pendulispora brunnea]|uniref:helix-turn-helix domain-containing protein n=1 Tax=Pendulispora brunnea TaxID=2905690 RepID=UPI00374E123A